MKSKPPHTRRTIRVAGHLDLTLARTDNGDLLATLGLPLGAPPAVTRRQGGAGSMVGQRRSFEEVSSALAELTNDYFDTLRADVSVGGRIYVRVVQSAEFESALREVARAVLVAASVARLDRFDLAGSGAISPRSLVELTYKDEEDDIVRVQASVLLGALTDLFDET